MQIRAILPGSTDFSPTETKGENGSMTIEYNGYELVQECHLAAGWSEAATFLHCVAICTLSKWLRLDTVQSSPSIDELFQFVG